MTIFVLLAGRVVLNVYLFSSCHTVTIPTLAEIVCLLLFSVIVPYAGCCYCSFAKWIRAMSSMSRNHSAHRQTPQDTKFAIVVIPAPSLSGMR